MGTLYKRTQNGKRGRIWQCEYTEHTGQRVQKSTGTRDKRTATRIMWHWENEAAKRASGLIDPAYDRVVAQSQRALTEHVGEFIASLESAGRSSIHTERTRNRIERVMASANWMGPNDITPESVERYAADLRKEGAAAQTIAHHLQAVKQLSRWMARTGRLRSNPLDTVTKPNPQSDRRRERRMLLPEEWPHLKSAAPASRAMLYELAIVTGLRSSEIRTLQVANLHLSAKPPYVTVGSGNTKDSKSARQYLTTALRTQLKKHTRGRRGLLYDLPDERDMAKMVRGDLAVAREAWVGKSKHRRKSDFLLPKNDAGEGFDFHSLRHTCGAWLAIRGVHPKTIQTIMRHKSITLTMDTYGHLFPEAEPQAVTELGSLL